MNKVRNLSRMLQRLQGEGYWAKDAPASGIVFAPPGERFFIYRAPRREAAFPARRICTACSPFSTGRLASVSFSAP